MASEVTPVVVVDHNNASENEDRDVEMNNNDNNNNNGSEEIVDEEPLEVDEEDENDQEDDGVEDASSAAPPTPVSESVSVSTSRSTPLLSQALTMAAARQIMLDNYTPWVMSTYGDSAKTKTITSKKYARIVALLKSTMDKESSGSSTGSEPASGEAAKFRLWVKSKGFHLGPPAGHVDFGSPGTAELLYLPTGTDKSLDGKVHFVYKKVAMVEQFFDIIYSVHVEAAGDTQLRGRAGKHCGQKRTYRAVADQYAFIPREAISKFLLYCIECQRKNSLENRNRNAGNAIKTPNPKQQQTQHQARRRSSADPEGSPAPLEESSGEAKNGGGTFSVTSNGDYHPLSPAPSLVRSPFQDSPKIISGVASPPSTPSSSVSTNGTATTSLSPAAAFTQAVAAMQSQMRSNILHASPLHQSPLLASQAFHGVFNPATQMFPPTPSAALLQQKFSGDLDLSLPITSTYLRRMRAFGMAVGLESQYRNFKEAKEESDSGAESSIDMKKESGSEDGGGPASTNSETSPSQQHQSQLSALLSQANGQMANGLNEGSGMNEINQDDSSSTGAKDDEDDDDEDDEKLEGHDPEKLKAFNMFVRLFVDENLDRHVPISRQPKEKIQAIIDSCTRQFPEYASRGRKRIRTYLKSCRRTKRTREQAGLDSSNARPTPPHLTSVQAEHLLARACENESENAKRMRMGLEPISQPMPVFTTATPVDVLAAAAASLSSSGTATMITSSSSLTSTPFTNADKQLKTDYKSEQLASLLAAAQQQQQQQHVPAISPTSTASAFSAINGKSNVNNNGPTLFRMGGMPAGNPNFTGALPMMQQANAMPNGPTMDGLKRTPLLSHKLSQTEMGAVRQLINGYRESAAFLLRSADELENLLQIQHKL